MAVAVARLVLETADAPVVLVLPDEAATPLVAAIECPFFLSLDFWSRLPCDWPVIFRGAIGAFAKPAPTFSLRVSLGLSRQHGQSAVGDNNVSLLNDALLCLSAYARQGNNLKESCFSGLFIATIDHSSSAKLNSLLTDSLGLISTCFLPGCRVIIWRVADPPDAFNRGRASWELVRR